MNNIYQLGTLKKGSLSIQDYFQQAKGLLLTYFHSLDNLWEILSLFHLSWLATSVNTRMEPMQLDK